MNAKEAVLKRIQATAGKTASARERKQNKGSATGFVSVWNDAVMDLFGKEHCVAPTQKTSGMLLKALKRLPNQNAAHIKLFINYVVENWAAQRANNSKWPEYPDMKAFTWSLDRLYLSYCRKDQSKVRLNGAKKTTAATDNKLEAAQSELRATKAQLERLTLENQALKSRIEMLTGR